MSWLFLYVAMMLTTSTFIWALFDSRGTLDGEGKKTAMLMGLLWPITVVVLIMINSDKNK